MYLRLSSSIVILCLALAGCGRSNETSSSNETNGSQATNAPVGQVPGPTIDAATTLKYALQNADQQAREWLGAWGTGNIDKLVALSEPPFFIDPDSPPLRSKDEIRAAYAKNFANFQNPGSVDIQMDELGPQTIGDLRAKGAKVANPMLTDKLGLTEGDIVVSGSANGQGLALFFRPSGAHVHLVAAID